jgi:hypothetical protein
MIIIEGHKWPVLFVHQLICSWIAYVLKYDVESLFVFQRFPAHPVTRYSASYVNIFLMVVCFCV